MVNVSEAGNLKRPGEPEGDNSNITREELAGCCDDIEKEIERIVSSRLKTIDSDQAFVRRQKGLTGQKLSKTLKRKKVRGSLTHVFDNRKMKSEYLKLVEMRAEIMQKLVISGKKTNREETLAGEILTER